MKRSITVLLLGCVSLFCADREGITYDIINTTKEPLDVSWNSGGEHPQYARGGDFKLGAGQTRAVAVWGTDCVNVSVQSQVFSAQKAAIQAVCFSAPITVSYENDEDPRNRKITLKAGEMKLPS